MKVWIKAYQGDKIIESILINKRNILSRKIFEEIIREACHEFDYSTPIILDSHYKHFRNFNLTKFLPRDFIEPVIFDKMTAENCAE